MYTRIIAHRGEHTFYQENTIEAFKKAIELEADGIELDVHLTKDQVLVVYHDFDMFSLTGEHKIISEYTLEALKTIKFKRGESIPTLDEVIMLLNMSDLKPSFVLNVELKAGSDYYPGIEQAVLNICSKIRRPMEIIYSSFDHYALVQLKALDNKIKTGVLTASALVEPWHYIKRLEADYYHPHYLTLNGKTIKELMLENIFINPYTVNDLNIGKILVQSNVNSIITDRLEDMIKMRNEVINEA
ncbi:MAG: glycerophosphodiester phosphodiesterase [Clostridia bacterium]|nr:glycerophosphodiester phosphodiesterase [Clostridia bacterium]